MRKLGNAAGETFASLRIRNFRLFFIGQGISQVGNWLTLTVQVVLILRLTGSGVAMGLLTAAQFAPVLLLGAWAGLVADRSDKRKLLLIVQAVAMVQSFALAVLASMDQPPIAGFYLLAVVGGVTMAFDNPARRAFVVEMVPQDEINNAVGLNSTLMTSARVIGPLFAAPLVAKEWFGLAFLGDGISYFAVLVALYLMRTSELRPAPVTPKGKGQVRAGLRYARSVPELWVPLAMMAVIGTLAFNFSVVFPLFVVRDLGGSDSVYPLLLAFVSVGSLLGALLAARRASTDLRLVALTAVGFGVSLAGLAITVNLGLAFAVGFFVGFTSIGFLTASTAIVQIEAAPEMRGRVLALQAMLFLGTTPIGGPIVGGISDQFGARWALFVGAVAAAGAGVWGLQKANAARDAQGSAVAPPAGGQAWDVDVDVATAEALGQAVSETAIEAELDAGTVAGRRADLVDGPVPPPRGRDAGYGDGDEEVADVPARIRT